MYRLRMTWIASVATILGSACADLDDVELPPRGDVNATDTDPSSTVALHEHALSVSHRDRSGKVVVQVSSCAWVGASNSPSADCNVDPDFVLVGGGAEIEGDGHPGALLTASYPDANKTTWHAASKAHEYDYPHRLRAYAIGLRVQGMSREDLARYVQYSEATSGASLVPSAVAPVANGYLLIGGGARVNWQGRGQLLTSSRPDGNQWVAEGKAHSYADSATITAFAIGIRDQPLPRVGRIQRTINSASTWSGSGYNYAALEVSSGYALVSTGATAQYDNPATAGRLLSDIVPFADSTYSRPGTRATSKDHRYPDSGRTTAYVIGLQVR